MQEHISNPASERAILGGIFSYGSDAFIDVDDVIDVKSFTIEENQILYACLKKVLETSSSVDLPSVLSAASSLGFESAFDKKISTNHVRSITNLDIDLDNVRHHAIKIKKLEIARDIRSRAKRVQADISDVSGDESIDELISIGETPFFELSAALNDSVDDKPVTLGEEIDEYISHLEENPCEMLGLSSGFTRFDTAIGGGFRRKCVDLIAARPKTGKSMLADNFAMHIAGNLGVPVLMLDTEMSKEDHWNRLLANFSGIEINDISTGNFANISGGKERVHQASEKLKDIPFDYISIAGKAFEETLSIIRRWIIKNVGFDENGRTKDCMLIYDYLKLMNSGQINDNLAEFQVLGFQITQLHNFTVQYDVPCLAFVQLNRDGVTKESTEVVSGSDRLIWLCSSFSIFKSKSDEEIAEDQGKSGNRKLVPIVARHGGGLSDSYDYINISMQGEIGKVVENETKNELLLKNRKGKDGFDHQISDEEKPF
tara:strand:+ start:2465 stop:3922 length:1458 start_codon:yes stop_codon:yes gene_type:complete